MYFVVCVAYLRLKFGLRVWFEDLWCDVRCLVGLRLDFVLALSLRF